MAVAQVQSYYQDLWEETIGSGQEPSAINILKGRLAAEKIINSDVSPKKIESLQSKNITSYSLFHGIELLSSFANKIKEHKDPALELTVDLDLDKIKRDDAIRAIENISSSIEEELGFRAESLGNLFQFINNNEEVLQKIKSDPFLLDFYDGLLKDELDKELTIHEKLKEFKEAFLLSLMVKDGDDKQLKTIDSIANFSQLIKNKKTLVSLQNKNFRQIIERTRTRKKIINILQKIVKTICLIVAILFFCIALVLLPLKALLFINFVLVGILLLCLAMASMNATKKLGGKIISK